jgi:histidine triad (HIT) family protein
LDCVFCEIANGESPASFVYKDEAMLAFMDIQPVNRGHLLVVPRTHRMLMHEYDEVTLHRTWQLVGRMAMALRSSGLPVEGINILVADGEAAFQDVPHFHVHVIPRNRNDGFGLTFPPGYENPPARPELDAVANSVRIALG